MRRRLVTTLIRLGSHPWLIHWPIVCAAGARLKTAGVELRRARSCACVSSGRAGFIYFLCSVCAPAPRVDLVALVQTPDAFPDLITPSSADAPGNQVAKVVADELAGCKAVDGEAACPMHCRRGGAQPLVTILAHDQTLLQQYPHVFSSGFDRMAHRLQCVYPPCSAVRDLASGCREGAKLRGERRGTVGISRGKGAGTCPLCKRAGLLHKEAQERTDGQSLTRSI